MLLKCQKVFISWVTMKSYLSSRFLFTVFTLGPSNYYSTMVVLFWVTGELGPITADFGQEAKEPFESSDTIRESLNTNWYQDKNSCWYIQSCWITSQLRRDRNNAYHVQLISGSLRDTDCLQLTCAPFKSWCLTLKNTHKNIAHATSVTRCFLLRRRFQ